jgi:hypothetical protein
MLVELEITPEPTDEERAAIVAALDGPPGPAGPWRDSDPEPDDGQPARRKSAGALRA